MYVCKSFYQQFEWAEEQHWKAVSCLPVLICQGDDDTVTTMDGAQNLLKLLLHQNSTTDKETITRGAEQATSTTKVPVQPLPQPLPFKNTTNSESRFRLVVINKAGHSLLEEQPTQIASYMEEFICKACGLNVPGPVAVIVATSATDAAAVGVN